MAPNYQDKGKMQVTFRHFWLGSQPARDAANAAECAGEQKKFWEFSQIAFKRQGQFTRANLKNWASEVSGLDTAAFGACFDANKHDLVVLGDSEEGKRRGINSTPTIYVNGQLLREGFPALSATVDRLAR